MTDDTARVLAALRAGLDIPVRVTFPQDEAVCESALLPPAETHPMAVVDGEPLMTSVTQDVILNAPTCARLRAHAARAADALAGLGYALIAADPGSTLPRGMTLHFEAIFDEEGGVYHP